jgi:hypothetical protein
MTRAACGAPLAAPELLQYWLGELEEPRELTLDEHLFACGACSERLGAIVDLGAAVRQVFLEGWLNVMLPEPFIRGLQSAGFKVREYDLAAGGSVNCTVTPEDDFVVSYLRAPLAGVQRLDVLIDDSTSGQLRANDVAFDPAAGLLVAVTSTVYLRTLEHSQQRVRLVAVEGAEERVLGDYTFNHSPPK